MAEHEFERFLEVLSRLLKLSSKETAAVADEICDHLEERYSELVAHGASRDDAVKQALDEFDDAGEFASKLNQLVRQRTRRRIMTGTLTTAAASALAILVTTAFWPDQRPGGPVVAQTSAAPENLPPAESPDIVYVDEGQFLPEWMRKHVEDDLQPQTLLELKRFLQDFTGRIVGVDITALQRLGLDDHVQIRETPASAPLYMVLDRALVDVGGHDLDWLVDPDDGILKISTRDKIQTIKSPLTLDVSAQLNTGLAMEGVIDLLQSQTTGPWHAVDGEGGTITPLGNRITIVSNSRTHLQCQAVLAAFAARGRRISVSEPYASKAIDEALTKSVSCSFQKTTLRDAIADFSRQTGQRFVFDARGLEDVGLGLDCPVTLSIKSAPLGTALKLLWSAVADEAGVEPRAIRKDGLLVITSEEDEPLPVVEILDVSDLVSQDELPQLVSLIYHATWGPWQDVDGEGGTISELPGARIIVTQTPRDLDRVIRLLNSHRSAAKGAIPVAALDPDSIEVRYYRMTEAQAVDLKTIIPKYVAVDSWKPFADGSMPAIDKISIDGLPAPAGFGGGGGFFQIGGDPSPEVGEKQPAPPAVMALLVIRQTRRVHLEIEKFLKDLTRKSGRTFFDPISDSAGPRAGMGGLGGGFF